MTLTLKASDESDAPAAEATLTITVKNLIEDAEEITHDFQDPEITWRRIPKTNFLMAQDTSHTRRPEYEFNGQIPPCSEPIPYLRQEANKYDSYRLDVHLEETTFRYRDPKRSREWTDYHIDPSDSLYRGEAGCGPLLTDLWNEAKKLYALDTARRLILAYDLDPLGTTYTRVPEEDIPLSITHYRIDWEVQGILGRRKSRLRYPLLRGPSPRHNRQHHGSLRPDDLPERHLREHHLERRKRRKRQNATQASRYLAKGQHLVDSQQHRPDECDRPGTTPTSAPRPAGRGELSKR